MTELTLRIDGMSCDHCVRRVTSALEGALAAALETAPEGPPGGKVQQVRVGSATVDYDGRPESLAAIIQALDRVGYAARPDTEIAHS